MLERARFAVAMIACLAVMVLAVPQVQGTVYSIDKDPNHQLYGNLNQNHIPNGGQYMCGPTAAVNSFMYLQRQYPNYFNSSLIGDADGDGTPDTYQDMITVAQTVAGANFMNTQVNLPGQGSTGTWDDMFIYGKYTYMQSVLPANRQAVYAAQLSAKWGWRNDGTPPIPKPAWVQDQTTPTWNFLWNQLTSCEDVEILITWSDEGGDQGHYLTVKSFNWNDANNNGVIEFAEGATIDYIDPATGAVGVSPIWQVAPNNPLDVGYGNNQTQVIMIMSESVPEPTTVSLLVLGGLMLARRRRS